MKKMILALALTLSMAPAAFSSDDHNHEPAVGDAPHGGILRDAAPYKAELVLNKDTGKIYVYDKDLKAVDAAKLKDSIKGQLAFPKDKKKKDVTFSLKGGAYESKLAGINKVHRYDLHVTLQVDGKPFLVDFGVDNIH